MIRSAQDIKKRKKGQVRANREVSIVGKRTKAIASTPRFMSNRDLEQAYCDRSFGKSRTFNMTDPCSLNKTNNHTL